MLPTAPPAAAARLLQSLQSDVIFSACTHHRGSAPSVKYRGASLGLAPLQPPQVFGSPWVTMRTARSCLLLALLAPALSKKRRGAEDAEDAEDAGAQAAPPRRKAKPVVSTRPTRTAPT